MIIGPWFAAPLFAGRGMLHCRPRTRRRRDTRCGLRIDARTP